ncbi:MAG: peptidoglycan-binding protein [Clostridia bacterium]|nr:peptidoglycan-binding protein [Clostridia bacterium]
MSDKKRTTGGGNKAASRRRTKKQRRQYNSIMRLLAVAVSLMVLAAVVIVVAPKRSHTVIINHPSLSPDVEIAAPPMETDEPQLVRIDPTKVPATATPSATPVLTDAPTEVPTEEPQPTEAAADAGFEYLPVYKKADIFERKIAITVDDCFQVQNLQTIATVAYQNGGRITIFPIGENLSKSGMADTLKTCAFKLGFEIENHTWSHSRIFRLPEIEMAKEIWNQSQALNMALGVNYEQHFFRLMGGDGSSDQRTHNYLKQLGYKGIAEWSLSGSDADIQEIEAHLQPGAIYLFHTTDRDTDILRSFIPYAVAQGYQLVTLNELLGFEPNAVSEYKAQDMPMPQEYVDEYRTHKVGDYAYNVVLMQDKLRELGLLVMEGESTGYYGEKTAEAIQKYQEQQGLPATGVADSETQKKLLGV